MNVKAQQWLTSPSSTIQCLSSGPEDEVYHTLVTLLSQASSIIAGQDHEFILSSMYYFIIVGGICESLLNWQLQ